MGVENMRIEQIYFYKDLYNEVDSSINNNTKLDIRKTVQQLTSLISSDKFLFLLSLEWSSILFMDIIAMYEMKEKFLSLKIFFPLIEELKNQKSLTELFKFFQLFNSKENPEAEDKLKIYKQIFEKYEDSIQKFEQSEEGKKAFNNIKSFFQVHEKKIGQLWNIYSAIFEITYYKFIDNLLDEQQKIDEQKKSLNLNDLFKKITEDFDNEEINLLIKNLLQIKSLNHTKDIYQLILFLFNIKKNEKEISLIEGLDKKFFDDIEDKLGITNIENIHKIRDCIFWIIYEKNFSKLNGKYSKYILEGNMTDKEKFCFDIFNKINDININNDINGIKIVLLQSLFTNNNKIILIKLDIEYFKKNIITLEQIDKNIKFIQLNIPNQFQNLNIYIQVENKIINFDNSYDKLLEELKKRNIIEQENKINIIKNNNDNININIENNDFNDINEIKELLTKEKNNNKILNEKIIRK